MSFYFAIQLACFIGVIAGVFFDWPDDALVVLTLASLIFGVRDAQGRLEKKVDELLRIAKGD